MSQTALDQFQSAPDAAGALARWADHLRIERQVSPHTLNAYLRDITQFTGFLKATWVPHPACATLKP
jgi:site-specific recombinase XerC